MWLKRLYLYNFRNYESAEVTFAPTTNLITGENGQGKTNLLEAIHLISTGRSFRTSHLSDLIRHGQSAFFIEAEFERDGIDSKITLSFDGRVRKAKINATTYNTFSNVLGLLPSVLFAPHDHSLIAGAPADRRRFLNIHIAQTDPLYVHHLLRYSKALKHRNALLKRKSENGIEVFEAQMAISARYLIDKRRQAIQNLFPYIDGFELRYHPSLDSQLDWSSRAKELILGATLHGPHRDDLHIIHDGKSAKSYSSEGQKRRCLATLKLAEWQLLSSLTGDKPLMAIDDFGVHLDESNSQSLEKSLNTLGQVFITSPTPPYDAEKTLLAAQGSLVST